MNEKLETYEVKSEGKKGLSPFWRVLIASCLIGVALVFSSYAGAIYSCNLGGGTMVSMACVNPISIGTCYDVGTGQAFIVNDDYYKELLPNGSLSDENYTAEYIENLTQ